VRVRRWIGIMLVLAIAGLLVSCGNDEPEPGFRTIQIDDGAPIAIGVSTMLDRSSATMRQEFA